MKDAEIKGKVVGEDSIPLIAEVTLTDEKGNTIEQTKSKTDGTYSIKTSLIDNQGNTVFTYYFSFYFCIFHVIEK